MLSSSSDGDKLDFSTRVKSNCGGEEPLSFPRGVNRLRIFCALMTIDLRFDLGGTGGLPVSSFSALDFSFTGLSFSLSFFFGSGSGGKCFFELVNVDTLELG